MAQVSFLRKAAEIAAQFTVQTGSSASIDAAYLVFNKKAGSVDLVCKGQLAVRFIISGSQVVISNNEGSSIGMTTESAIAEIEKLVLAPANIRFARKEVYFIKSVSRRA